MVSSRAVQRVSDVSSSVIEAYNATRMDKTKKRGLAKRAKSFKEDIIDILSNLRTQASTSSPPPPPNGKVKPLPVTPTTQANGTSKQRSPELLFILENLPSSINLSQHFTSEINKNILQVGHFPYQVIYEHHY